jgi:hypothetical protein
MLQEFALAEIEPLSGVVYIGDSCEEGYDELLKLAAACGRKSVKLFMFHELGSGRKADRETAAVFERMAKASGGAYCRFGSDSAKSLRKLLSTTVAAFSAAGADRKAKKRWLMNW